MSPHPTLADRLRGHVAPELLSMLAAGASLPPGVLTAECVRLRAELAAIASYVPNTLVRRQIADPQPGQVSGAYWRGSILFADLSGFTALSGTLSTLGKQGAEEISAIINGLFGALVEEIDRYRGTLLKFGGDAITAFFDAASVGPDHADLAARAALAMQRRMDAFAKLKTRAGTFALKLRIGVHSGQLFAAQVGGLSHTELVITGREINRVATAQEIAEPGELVVSAETLALLREPKSEARSAGFFRLASLPGQTSFTMKPKPFWTPQEGGLPELLALVQRIEALRPYLPRNLPRRFLSGDDGDAGEFRPVTVLFANFADVSAILELLGPDTDRAAQILDAYYRRAQEVIHRYGGIVNKVDMYTHGDKLMALFGAPVANGDDPQRAVRAALDLREALDAANAEIAGLLSDRLPTTDHRPPTSDLGRSSDSSVVGQQSSGVGGLGTLTQRIGINTGVVFAGKVGSAARHEYTVMGQHVNLAARLMSAAADDAVVLSPSTRRAVERVIAVQPLPPVRLKGIVEPVPIAAALTTPYSAPSADVQQTAAQRLLTGQLIGRETELAQLRALARTALGGYGQAVTIVGEAGSGKSRLIDDTIPQLLESAEWPDAALRPFFPYFVECQSHAQSTPYAMLRDLLGQFFSLSQIPSGAEQVAEVQRSAAALTPELTRFVPLLGDLLGLPIPATPLTSALSPEQRHDRAQDLAEALVLAAAREQPLVLAIDDLQWCDASSLEVLARIARRVADAPLLLLLAYRPDADAPEVWPEAITVKRIELRELSPDASTQLVEALLGGPAPAALSTLLERSQGNPFFLEEVVRELRDSGTLARNAAGAFVLTRPLDDSAIPDSVEGVITARLDRLEEGSREVLQVAAVVGRRFPYPVLSGVLQRDRELPERLRQLTRADLIQADDRELEYLFRQALTRDVAYGSILYARRRELHRRIARQLETTASEYQDEQAALLARHYLLAEEWQPALAYHLRAGRDAQERFANREAISLLERALRIAERPEIADDLVQAEVHERLADISTLIGEYEPALAHYDAALAAIEDLPDVPLETQVRLRHQIARVYEKRAAFDEALRRVEHALELASGHESIEVCRCLLLGAGLHRRQGRYHQAVEWGERARSMAARLGSLRDEAHATMLLGGTFRNLGDTARALELVHQSITLYQRGDVLDGLAAAYNDLGNTYFDLGRLDEARDCYGRALEINRTIGDVYGQGMIGCNLGEVLRTQGQFAAAIDEYGRALAIYRQIGSAYMMGLLEMNTGAAHLALGTLDEARTRLTRSAELFAQAGAEDFLPELERHVAELHLRRGELIAARLACDLSLANAAQLEARAEAGATRRVLAQVLASGGDTAGAWEQLQQSLTILRESGNPHELARTLVVVAEIAPALDRRSDGERALAEAIPLLEAVGALHDLERTRQLAERYH